MKREELIAEARRLKKKADEIEFFISGLTGERQQIAVAELSSKVRDLRSLQKSFEELIEPLPPAEGAEEIIESILESLGDPINIHNHAFEIRPYTVDHKTEWWIFHKEVASGEPLAQWLDKFATLHAQKIADKMVEERLKNAPRNCPKAAQCAHVKGGLKCPPNVICPL